MIKRLLLPALLASAILAGCHGVNLAPSPLSTGDHKAVINGKTLHYHVAGQGPVVIVHPGGPGIEWTYMKMPETEKNLKLVYLEPVGSGQSDRLSAPGDYTMWRYANDIDGLRAHLGLEQVYVMGHSHGGMVAMTYAVNAPNRIKGLILYGTTPVTNKAWLDDVESNIKSFSNQPWYAAARASQESETPITTDMELADTFRREIGFQVADYTSEKRKTDSVFADITCSIGPYHGFVKESERFDIRGALKKIKTPALVITGEKDFVGSPKFGGQINKSMRNAVMVVLKNTGHMAHIEDEKTFAAALEGFVSMVEEDTPKGKFK